MIDPGVDAFPALRISCGAGTVGAIQRTHERAIYDQSLRAFGVARREHRADWAALRDTENGCAL